MKVYRGNAGKVPCIRPRQYAEVSFTLQTLYPRRKNWGYTFDRRVDGPQKWWNKTSCLSQESNPSSPLRKQSHNWLSYSSSMYTWIMFPLQQSIPNWKVRTSISWRC